MAYYCCILLALLPIQNNVDDPKNDDPKNTDDKFDKVEFTKAKKRNQKSRSYTQIDKDISAFLRNEAIARSDFSRAAAIRDLCTIAIEVRYHDKFESSLMMQTLKNRIRSRLDKIAKKNTRKYKNKKLSDNDILLAEAADEPDIDLLLSQNMELAGFSSGGPLAFFSKTHAANGGGIIDRKCDQPRPTCTCRQFYYFLCVL